MFKIRNCTGTFLQTKPDLVLPPYSQGAETLPQKEQALVSMTATFWDTIVICSVTGLVIISSYLSDPASISGYGAGEYAIAAFGQVPYVGKPFLTFAIAGFAIATIVGWFYPGEQSVQFLFGKNEKKSFR